MLTKICMCMIMSRVSRTLISHFLFETHGKFKNFGSPGEIFSAR